VTFSLEELRLLGVAKPWGFCDFAFWLCGQIGSGWCGKERLGESFPTHEERWISLSGSQVMII